MSSGAHASSPMPSIDESSQNYASFKSGYGLGPLPLDAPSKKAQQVMRNNIIEQIIETERKYVQGLQITQKYLNSLSQGSKVAQDSFLLLYLKLDMLVKFQWEVLSRFESTAELPWEAQRWGQFFLECEDKFEVYVTYCVEYTNTAELITINEHTQHTLTPLSHSFDVKSKLPALLLKPIQRAFEYSLLLASLIGACSTHDYPYYEELKQGLGVAKRIVNKISKAQLRTEKELVVRNLSRRIDDWKGHRVNEFGDLLLNDIFVVTKSDIDREYHLFLFEKIILCCKEASRRPEKSQSKSWKSNFTWKKPVAPSPPPGQFVQTIRKDTPLFIKGRISLCNITTIIPASSPRVPSGYSLSVWWKGDDDLEHFTLQFRGEEQMRQWAAEISRLIEKYAKRRLEPKLAPPSSFTMSSTGYLPTNNTARQAYSTGEHVETNSTMNDNLPQGHLSRSGFDVDPDGRTPGHDITIVRRLDDIFRDVEQYKRLLRYTDSDAQKLLDNFQRILDMPEISSKFRRQLIVATQRLSRRTGLYPMCYALKDVELVGDDPVACGTFADIYKGCFGGRNVCLKVIRLYQTSHADSFLKQFSAEAILWGQLLHQNLLPIYGFYRFNSRLCLVSPWMEHGDVKAFLKHYPDANRILLVSDIVCGLAYLHDCNIVHGDIKGVNILVSGSRRACLADFGMSSITDADILHWTSYSSAASKGGSIRWQAPELFDVEDDHVVHNSKPSDVYALACVVYEMYIGKLPFFELGRDSVIMRKVKEGVRPSRPPVSSVSWGSWGLTESLWSLMERCWVQNPDTRPTAQAITGLLATESLLDDRPGGDGDMLSPLHFRNSQSGQHQGLSLGDIELVLKNLTR